MGGPTFLGLLRGALRRLLVDRVVITCERTTVSPSGARSLQFYVEDARRRGGGRRVPVTARRIVYRRLWDTAAERGRIAEERFYPAFKRGQQMPRHVRSTRATSHVAPRPTRPVTWSQNLHFSR